MFEAQTAETKRICGWQRAGPTWTLVKWTSWTSDWALFSNGAEQEEAFVFRPLNGPEFFLRGCRRLMWLHCRTSTRGNLSTGNSYQWVDKDVWFLLCRVLIRTATPEITRPQPKHQLQQASVLCWKELLWLSQSYLFMKAGRPETHVRSGEHVHLIWVWSQNLVCTCQVQIPWTRQEGSHFETTGRLMCFVLHFLVINFNELLPETFILSVQSLDHHVEQRALWFVDRRGRGGVLEFISSILLQTRLIRASWSFSTCWGRLLAALIFN